METCARHLHHSLLARPLVMQWKSVSSNFIPQYWPCLVMQTTSFFIACGAPPPRSSLFKPSSVPAASRSPLLAHAVLLRLRLNHYKTPEGATNAGGRRCVVGLVMRGDGDYQLLWRRSGAKGGGGVGRGGEARVSRGVVETSPLPRQGFPAAPSLTPGGASLQPLRGPAPPSPFRPRPARLPAGRRADAVS